MLYMISASYDDMRQDSDRLSRQSFHDARSLKCTATCHYPLSELSMSQTSTIRLSAFGWTDVSKRKGHCNANHYDRERTFDRVRFVLLAAPITITGSTIGHWQDDHSFTKMQIQVLGNFASTQVMRKRKNDGEKNQGKFFQVVSACESEPVAEFPPVGP